MKFRRPTHPFICSETRAGRFQIQRKTRADRMRANCRRSSRRCDGACTSQSSSMGGGWSGLSAATSTITPCQPMVRHWRGSGKSGDQGECGPAKHAPDAEPDERVTDAETHTYHLFLANRQRLAGNRTNCEVLAGPAREGLCLLQGLLLCGICGRRLSVRYTGNGGLYPIYQCNWTHREAISSSSPPGTGWTPICKWGAARIIETPG